MQNNKIECPVCGKQIELKPKEDNPARVQGFCNCGGKTRCVIEMDAQTKPVKPESFNIKEK